MDRYKKMENYINQNINQTKNLEELVNKINGNINDISNEIENTNTNNINCLQILEHDSERVLTTKQLAACYGTNVENIKKNFQRNKDRFRDGKDYFMLKGDELKKFKRKVNITDFAENSKSDTLVTDGEVTNCPFVSRNVNTFYLWTEMGALRHSKLLY
ncbi:ORF6N domain-containing protein [Thomasclavelia cocleata]|uniref:ORF6N domain-containing protein n=1 Tax=Thomasclavelia cocleata TaxID=69824 RepID=A0A1I0GB58_9FIRM|nr:ORF6N domain-containing protein [Thomasclavelia cocleata]MCR1959828.1 ORF6N domain-containing protein [Thomasclavelia cocleata]SET68224.1 ORF6N domain-containing protein [Thomasclavelia cocleata]